LFLPRLIEPRSAGWLQIIAREEINPIFDLIEETVLPRTSALLPFWRLAGRYSGPVVVKPGAIPRALEWATEPRDCR